jgi:hypothetical protein
MIAGDNDLNLIFCLRSSTEITEGHRDTARSVALCACLKNSHYRFWTNEMTTISMPMTSRLLCPRNRTGDMFYLREVAVPFDTAIIRSAFLRAPRECSNRECTAHVHQVGCSELFHLWPLCLNKKLKDLSRIQYPIWIKNLLNPFHQLYINWPHCNRHVRTFCQANTVFT